MAPTDDALPTLRVLVVDDEEPGRANLRYMLAECAGWQVAGEAGSAAKARALLAALPVDVVLLDIQMAHESGMDLARALCAEPEPPLIIFVTAFHAHAVDAFEVHALDYLLKPVNARRLAQALERAGQLLRMRQRAPYGRAVRACLDQQEYLQQLTIRSVGKIEWIHLDEVFWISAADNYVELHTADKTVLHRASMTQLERRLDPQRYMRVHRRAIVRIDQLAALAVAGDGAYVLTLHCGSTVPVSERYVQALRARCS